MFFLEMLVALLLVVAILYMDGTYLGWHLTTVEEGSMKFVVKGEDYVRTLLNVQDHHLDEKGKIEPGKPRQSFSLVRRLGFHWISWFWPFQKLHTFNLVTGNLLSEKVRQEKPIKQWVEEKDHPTDRLDLKIRSYVVVGNLELQDRFNVDLLTFVLIEIVDPRLAIFVYKANFVKILNSAILSGYVDKAKSMTYEEFIKKAKGRGSSFANAVCKYVNEGGNSPDKMSLEERYGVRLIETFVYDFQLSEEEEEAVVASKAKEIARLKAEATVETAKGNAEARRIEAEAKAKEFGVAIEALKAQGVDPNLAMDGYTTIRSTEAGAGQQTWVQRGAVDISNPFPPKEKSS